MYIECSKLCLDILFYSKVTLVWIVLKNLEIPLQLKSSLYCFLGNFNMFNSPDCSCFTSKIRYFFFIFVAPYYGRGTTVRWTEKPQLLFIKSIMKSTNMDTVWYGNTFTFNGEEEKKYIRPGASFILDVPVFCINNEAMCFELTLTWFFASKKSRYTEKLQVPCTVLFGLTSKYYPCVTNGLM